MNGDSTWVSVVEYFLAPFALVFASVFTKWMVKKSSRIVWKAFFAIGLDLLLMCTFGVFIYGLSTLHHNPASSDATDLFLLTSVMALLLYVLTAGIAVLVRHWGEHSLLGIWVPNTVAGIALFFLLWFVGNGTHKFNHGNVTGKKQSTEVSIDSTTVAP